MGILLIVKRERNSPIKTASQNYLLMLLVCKDRSWVGLSRLFLWNSLTAVAYMPNIEVAGTTNDSSAPIYGARL